MQNQLALVGRILLAILFIRYGFEKVDGFEGTVGYIAAKGLPMPAVLAALTTWSSSAAASCSAIGLLTGWAALALAGFALAHGVPVPCLLDLAGGAADGRADQLLQGPRARRRPAGLAGFGAGAISVDARRRA